MSLLVTIELDGPPRGKGRPRATVTKRGFAQVYTDDRTVKYESQLRYAASQEMAGQVPTDQPVALVMTVRFENDDLPLSADDMGKLVCKALRRKYPDYKFKQEDIL